MAYNFVSASSQYIDCGDINALDGISGLTIAFWAYRASASDQIALGKRNSTSNGF